MLALVQACDRAVYGDSDWTDAELREEWEGLDLEHGRVARTSTDGRIAGVMHRLRAPRRPDPRRRLRPPGAAPAVAPGRRLLAAAEERARELEPGLARRTRRSTIETAHLVGDPRAPALLFGRGYARVRTFFRMVRRRLEQPEPRRCGPTALELRAVRSRRATGRDVHAAIEEAFASEWGHEHARLRGLAGARLGVDAVRPRASSSSSGTVTRSPPSRSTTPSGWATGAGSGALGVRPAWRRRGLGLALLHESFRRFADRGETTAALGVDSENPTGATRLYERAGDADPLARRRLAEGAASR